MARQSRNIEFEESKEESPKSFSLRSLVDGNVLTQKAVMKQVPFLILLAVLGLLIIANRNHAEKLVIETNSLQVEVKELRTQAITTSSELMMESRQSMVERSVRERGLELEENKEPLRKLIRE